MNEQVTITPQAGHDSNGDPLPAGTPFDLAGLVAPGNTLRAAGIGGDLDEADFTVYLPLRHRRPASTPGEWEWVPVIDLLTGPTGEFTIQVRDRVCDGRAQLWNGGGGRGGVVVLATSATGKTP